MLYILLFVVVIAIILGPQAWAKHVLAKYSTERPDLPGSGGEMARHLIDHLGLDEVKLEPTERGDHYDPGSYTVRLLPGNMEGKSITAVATAAHEVGHAIQHRRKEPLLLWRNRLIGMATLAEQAASLCLMLSPLVIAVTRSPAAGTAMLGVAVASAFLSSIVHFVTLPMEWDASFGKAMPLLERGQYLNESDLSDARKVLRACALTYVAASMASLLNVFRWLRFLRR